MDMPPIQIQPPTPILADSSRLIKYSHTQDGSRDYASDAPTASGFAGMLQEIDEGNLRQMMELNAEMEAKDAHLNGVASTRRRALTALGWEVVPAEHPADQELANEAAAFVTDTLRGLRSFRQTLKHMATAIGPNVSATELIWEGSRLVETVDVPGHRLNQEPHVSPQLFVLTEENSFPGVPMLAGKFLVHTPDAGAGFPFRSTIMRAGAWLYLLKHFAKADWAAFTEVFGMPMRIGRYDNLTDEGQRQDVQEMLRDMSTDFWGLFPKEVEVEFHNVGASGSPHNELIDWIERKQSILYLGQTLTTENSTSTGSLSLGKVHDNVRTDILLSDIADEAATLEDNLFTWIIALGFPNRSAPVPHFKRLIIEQKNLDNARLRMEQVAAAEAAGLTVSVEDKYEAYGITPPKLTPSTPEGEEDSPDVEETETQGLA